MWPLLIGFGAYLIACGIQDAIKNNSNGTQRPLLNKNFDFPASIIFPGERTHIDDREYTQNKPYDREYTQRNPEEEQHFQL